MSKYLNAISKAEEEKALKNNDMPKKGIRSRQFRIMMWSILVVGGFSFLVNVKLFWDISQLKQAAVKNEGVGKSQDQAALIQLVELNKEHLKTILQMKEEFEGLKEDLYVSEIEAEEVYTDYNLLKIAYKDLNMTDQLILDKYIDLSEQLNNLEKKINLDINM